MNSRIHNINNIPTAIFDSSDLTSSTSANPEAAVFIHGNPGPMDDWSQLIPQIKPFLRTIAMDLPGFGRSARPKNFNYSIPGYVEHLNAIVEYLGLKKVHLILHDFGGAFGGWWASQNPEKVASMTLINTGCMPDYSWHLFARIWQTPIIGELFSAVTTPSMLERSINYFNPKPLPKEFITQVTRYADWRNKKAVLKLYRATRDTNRWLGHELAQQLKSISNVNACVIWGEQDTYLPVKYAEAQRQVFHNAQIHTIPKTGHWPFIDNPKAVQEILVPFLEHQVKNITPKVRKQTYEYSE